MTPPDSLSETLGLTVYQRVISQDVLQEINASIDAVRDSWSPADGRGEPGTAKHFCDLLRRSESFCEVERMACESTQEWVDSVLAQAVPRNTIHTIRCVNRKTPSSAYLMHHDRHLLTVLIPLQIAEPGERNGDLIIYRNREALLTPGRHLLAKALLFAEQSMPISLRRALIRRHLASGRCVRIPVVPGNVYCFNGLISLHANLEVEAGERRSLLVHHFEPWRIVAGRRIIRRLRDVRDRIADPI